MKISKNDYTAFNLSKYEQEQIIHNYINNYTQKEERERIIKLYISQTNDNYLITKNALETIKNIKYTDSKELRELIINSYTEPTTIIFDKINYLRFVKVNDNKIGCFYVYKLNDDNIYYDSFAITNEEIINCDNSKNIIDLVIKTLIFIKCTNTEILYLSPKLNKPKKCIISDEKYVLCNDMQVDVKLVTSMYNKFIIKTDKFWVNTHGRFQHHGEGNILVKYIIIEGYYKNGYKRGFK